MAASGKAFVFLTLAKQSLQGAMVATYAIWSRVQYGLKLVKYTKADADLLQQHPFE